MVFRGLLIITLSISYPSAESFAQAGPGNQQRSRPSLFSHLPETLPIDSILLNDLFSKLPGDTVNLLKKSKTVFRAVVTEKINYEQGYSSLNLKLLQFPGTLCTFSRSINLKNNLVFRGRIFHPSFNDVYTLEIIDGQYRLSRQPVKKMLAE